MQTRNKSSRRGVIAVPSKKAKATTAKKLGGKATTTTQKLSFKKVSDLEDAESNSKDAEPDVGSEARAEQVMPELPNWKKDPRSGGADSEDYHNEVQEEKRKEAEV